MAIWTGILTLLFIATLSGLWFTGVPQRRALEALVASQLNAHVEVGAVSLKNPIAINSLVVADAAQSIYTPLLRIDHIGARYRWQPDAVRHIESLTLQGVRLAIEGGGDNSNYQFLEALFTASTEGGTTDPGAWIPEQFHLKDFWFETRFPGYYLRLENVGAEGNLVGLESGTLAIQAPQLGLAWESVLAPGGAQSHVGALGLNMTWSENAMAFDGKLDFGRLAQAEGTVRLSQSDTGRVIEVSLPTARLDDPLWSAVLIEHLPTPVRFEGLSLSNVHFALQSDASGYRVDAAELDGEVTSIAIGPEEAPYYEGPLTVAMHGSYGEHTTLAADLRVADGLALAATAALSEGRISGTLAVPPWPRDTIKALLPEDYRSYLDIVAPLKTLGASVELAQSENTIALSGSLSPAFADEKTLDVPFSLTLETTDTAQNVLASAAMTLGEETASTEMGGVLGQSLTLTNALKGVDPKRWTETLLGAAIVPDLKGVFTGDVTVKVIPDTPLEVGLDLQSAGLGYGDLILSGASPTGLKGTLHYDLLTGRAQGSALDIKDETLGDLALKKWSLDTSTSAFKTDFETLLQFGALMEVFGLSDPYGTVAMAGDFDFASDSITMRQVVAESKDFGYGDWSVPYGATLTVAGDLVYGLTENAMSLAPIEVRLDEGTRISAVDFGMVFPNDTTEFKMKGTGLSLRSDLDVLVQLGYLASVVGGEATLAMPTLNWDGDGFKAPTTWQASAAHLKLADDMAEFENLDTRGEYGTASSTEGSGPLSADSVLIYGMAFGAIDTQLEINEKHIACKNLETTFLEGDLVVSARLEYLDAALPIVADLKVSNLDLAEFTKAFEPPDVELTGSVSGTVSLSMTLEGLTALDVDLVSSEGLSLNRDMVRQILMSQYVNDAVGSKQIQKIMEKVVGTEEQRPFDKATLDLGLKDGFIDGVARLESATLDVTVDIHADPAALLEAIKSSNQ